MVKKKHQPPAKIRYDSTHPVASVRVDQKLKQQLDVIKRMSGKSVGDILREAVGVQNPSTKNAYALGFSNATKAYRVQYKCNICGGTALLQSSEEKKAAAQYMREHGWAHANCIK